MQREIQMPLAIDDISIGVGHREVNAAAVKRLADSIDKIGLRHPITVRERGDKYQLIAGRHRIEACRKLGRDFVQATIVKMNNDDARLWEIAENLHRAELTKLERDENIAEWIKITDRASNSQSGSLREDGRGGRPKGIENAARELGVERQDAHRAVKVASLSDEAKEAARETGLDDNRSALLEAASKPTVAEQVAAIHQRHTPKVVKIADDPLNDIESAEKQVAVLMAAWNRAGKEAREEFLLRIDQPVIGKKWA
jgi:ParB family transcriptional regulator, chromosome partitioning protein